MGVQPDVPVFEPTIRERLLLVQAVYEYGADEWDGISQLMSHHPLVTRPDGSFSPEICQSVYTESMRGTGQDM